MARDGNAAAWVWGGIALLAFSQTRCESAASSANDTYSSQNASGDESRTIAVRPPPPAPDTTIDPQRAIAVCRAAIERVIAERASSADGATTESDAGGDATSPAAPRPTVVGGIPPASVRRTILSRLDEVAACQSTTRLERPSAAGRIVTLFVVGPTGAVIAAAVRSSTSPSRYLQQCLVNTIRDWAFDAPEGGGVVTISYPFSFDSGSADKSR